MPIPLTEEQIRRTAEFYGIDMTEAYRRYEIMQAHTDDPNDPICVGCVRRAGETTEFDQLMDGEEYTRLHQPGNEEALAEARRKLCLSEEGTLNRENGHFLCLRCYIKNGMPTSSRGWTCP